MKMCEENYRKLTSFYNYSVENANDKDVEFILMSIGKAAAAKKAELDGKEDINYDNPNLSKHNAAVVRDFMEDFLSKANDDEAIYLIEGLKALVKKMIDNPEDVAKFIVYKKNEAKLNAKKEK